LSVEKRKVDSLKQARRIEAFKEFLSLLPSSKMKTFLLKQLEKARSKPPKKNIFFLVFTVIATFLIGSIYWLLKKTKRIHY